MNNKPYFNLRINKNTFLRFFSPFVDAKTLIWHKDKKDRHVFVIFNLDWQFQFDNCLPFLLKKNIFIKKEEFHRVIKGKFPLIILIKE